MARTLIGNLILRLQTEGLGEASKVTSTMRDIEGAARRLSSAPWGAGFQGQIDKLGVSGRELTAVAGAWRRLHSQMSSQDLAGALQKSNIAAWKSTTIAHLASVRSSARDTEHQFRSMTKAMRAALQPALVAGGAYTFGYAAGMAGREALNAASQERRVQAEAKYAGLSGEERGRIDTRADDLAGRYRINKSQIFEVMKEASLSMPSTDVALAVSDEMARAYLVLSNMIGPEGAITGLRQFNKAMDNIEKVTPDEYKFGLENYMKAQQVVGKDMDPTAFAEAIKFSRASGKVFSDEFLFKWLPMLIAESGGSDSGTQLRAAFDQFIVGRASKKALAEQESMGLRDEAGRLLNQEAFTQNPLTWIYDTLLPKLKEKGVDTENETELARVIGELTNNRLSSDLLMRGILSFQQYRRLVEERLPNASGLDAADQIQKDNPFAAYEGFKSSLENLSAAVLPMPAITTGLNLLSDTLNGLRERIKAGDPMVTGTAGLAATAAAGWATWKVAAGIGGLITAGTNLNISAAALQAAAASLGGAGMAGDVPGGKPGGPTGIESGWGLAALVARAVTSLGAFGAGVQSLGDTPGDTYDEQVKNQGDYRKRLAYLLGINLGSHDREHERDRYKIPESAFPPVVGSGAIVSGDASSGGGIVGKGRPVIGGSNDFDQMLSSMDNLKQQAAQAGTDVQNSLSVTARPIIDSGSIDAFLAKVHAATAALQGLSQSVSNNTQNAEREMRRNFTDYGVTP